MQVMLLKILVVLLLTIQILLNFQAMIGTALSGCIDSHQLVLILSRQSAASAHHFCCILYLLLLTVLRRVLLQLRRRRGLLLLLVMLVVCNAWLMSGFITLSSSSTALRTHWRTLLIRMSGSICRVLQFLIFYQEGAWSIIINCRRV